jgi:hypothetical protein
MAVPLFGLADVDPDEFRRSAQFHFKSPFNNDIFSQRRKERKGREGYFINIA